MVRTGSLLARAAYPPDHTNNELAREGAGLPRLGDSAGKLSVFEFWPTELFYIPVMAYAAFLSMRHRGMGLPSAANPGLPYGGLIGESKSAILGSAEGEAKKRVPPFVTVDVVAGGTPGPLADTALGDLIAAGIPLPVVAKPDIGCRGFGVQIIRGRDDLVAYIKAFPTGYRFLLQQLIDLPGEAGIYFIKRPDTGIGRIYSVTLKYFPHITGDGRRTVAELIDADPRAGRIPHIYKQRHAARLDDVLASGEQMRLAFSGSHSKGAVFKNGTPWVTPAMERAIDRVVSDIPGYCIGRLDIRFADFQALRHGSDDFVLIEANGAGGEPTEIWDGDTTLPEAYKAIFGIVKELWEIGAINRKAGVETTNAWRLFKLYQAEKRLWQRYPPTH